MSQDELQNGRTPDTDGRSRALALVPARSDVQSAYGDSRPTAGFVTQLIACHRRLPAYRTKAQASSETAKRSYGRDAPPARATLDFVV